MIRKLKFSYIGLPLLFLTLTNSFALPPKPTSYVSDLAGILDLRTKQQLETILTELEQKTSAELAVVTVKGLEGRDIEGYANELFTAWHIGKKGKDNGVLFLVSPSDRKMRIEVGYGLEGILPDGYVGRIRDTYVLPYFKKGDLSSGIQQGTLALVQAITNSNPGPPPSSNEQSGGADLLNILFVLGFPLLALFLILRKNAWPLPADEEFHGDFPR